MGPLSQARYRASTLKSLYATSKLMGSFVRGSWYLDSYPHKNPHVHDLELQRNGVWFLSFSLMFLRLILLVPCTGSSFLFSVKKVVLFHCVPMLFICLSLYSGCTFRVFSIYAVTSERTGNIEKDEMKYFFPPWSFKYFCQGITLFKRSKIYLKDSRLLPFRRSLSCLCAFVARNCLTHTHAQAPGFTQCHPVACLCTCFNSLICFLWCRLASSLAPYPVFFYYTHVGKQ